MTTPWLAAERRSARLWWEAVLAALSRQGRVEWFGSPPHLAAIARPRAEGFEVFPRDFRPARPSVGRALLGGTFILADEALALGPGGDPWNRASPSRAFAESLHRFDWLRDLLMAGDEGAREALRLIQEWRLTFGRWSSFAWSGEILERRVVNLATNLGPIVAVASEAEVEMLANLLARQARQLLIAPEPVWRTSERAVAAAIAGAALSGRAGARLLARAGRRVGRDMAEIVLPDGGHVSRSPEAGLELLLDLLALDDGWTQRGLQVPDEAVRAIDRLTAGLRFFTLPDGRLACFQGGEESTPDTVAAARAHDDISAAAPPPQAPHSGYQRLVGRSIQVMMDVGVAAPPPWNASACAQPAAIEVVCGKDRLITNTGWSLRAPWAQALRLADAGSTVALGHGSPGAPLNGWQARLLGPRLVGGAQNVEVKRANSDTGVWLDFTHDGWAAELGLMHARRLYLDLSADELRGEDQFVPTSSTRGRPLIPYAVHFHLPPEVEAVVARDHRSVLLRGPSSKGWWLRNDARDVRVEPSVHFQGGRQVASHQVMLLGHIHAEKGGRVRWKLTAVE
jgi:uncharacterized heparinase superfamily protein